MNPTEIEKELRELAPCLPHPPWQKLVLAAADIVHEFGISAAEHDRLDESHLLAFNELKVTVDALENDKRHLEAAYAMADTNIALLRGEVLGMTGKRDTLAAENERQKQENHALHRYQNGLESEIKELRVKAEELLW
jgi:chromosome segregation ATPase